MTDLELRLAQRSKDLLTKNVASAAIKARAELAGVRARHIHCENCGGSWLDDGLNGGCQCLLIKELREAIEHKNTDLDSGQIRAIACLYTLELGKASIVDQVEPSKDIEHLLWMTNELCDFAAAGKAEKANRWLGFVQGAMWQMKIRTIDEMRADVRWALTGSREEKDD